MAKTFEFGIHQRLESCGKNEVDSSYQNASQFTILLIGLSIVIIGIFADAVRGPEISSPVRQTLDNISHGEPLTQARTRLAH